ncbi:MAG: hypothetical protein RSF40_04895 [Oscillospiraceae bacterium]
MSSQNHASLMYGNVVAIDAENKTMDVAVGDKVTMMDISLNIITGGDSSVLVFPTIGSLVVIGFIQGQNDTAFPVKFSEIDSISIKHNTSDTGDDIISTDDKTIFTKRGNSSCKIENDLISLNGGKLDGLVVVGELTKRLNKLNDKIYEIQSAITSHTHTCSAPGQPTSATIYKTVPMTSFENSDYENTKIKQ